MNKPEDNFYDRAGEIDQLLSAQFTDSIEIKVFGIIINDSAATDYFLKRVASLNWFRPLKERQFFAPHKAPSPRPADQGGYFVPEWNILPYLERVSQQVNTPGSEKYTDELLTIIKEVSNYKDSNGQHIDNYRTWWYFVKILLNIPNKKIPSEIIELIPIWLDSKFDAMLQGSEITTKLLPKFLTDDAEDIRKAEKIIGTITAIKTYPLSEERTKILGEKEEDRLVVDPYWLKETFDEYAEIIGEKCSKRVIENLANKIRGLLKRVEDGTYESLYSESEHSTDDPLEILTFILKRILLAKAKTDVDTANGILRDFLNDKYLYFPKMAIYIIGQNIDNYGVLFWEILGTETGALIMESTLYFGDELKYLLQNLKNLTDEQRKMLDIKIKQAAEHQSFKEDAERYKSLYREQIYQALSDNPYFKNLYDEMKKMTSVDAELHPAIKEGETRIGSGPSPLSREEILRMTNGELAEFFSTFRTKDFWEGPTVGGLSYTLKEAVKADANKFTDNLNPFEDAGFIYIYRILDGLKDVWKEKKAISWSKLFDFITSYIKKEQFWKDEYVVEKGDWLGGADHNWVIGIIAELIQEGTRDDSWAFTEDQFDKAKEIIFYLLKQPKEDKEDKEITDYVTHTLNTPCGKLISSLVNLALRIARLNDKNGIKAEPRWSEEYKNKFDEILEKKIIEAYTSLGRFLPNFYYLDKNWVEDKIEQVSTEKGSKYWQAFMDGYLSIGTVYDEIYERMKPHYQYSLSYNFKDKRDREHLVQHICVGYLRDHEKLDDPDSLFRKVIDAWKPEQIKEIIGFFSMQGRFVSGSPEENERMRARIIDFWRHLYGRYKGKDEKSLTQEDKKILSSASKLAVFLSQIDTESYDWLMLSAPYVHEDFNSPFLIECLDKLKDKGDSKKAAKCIGEIYLKMLEKITPDYDKKHIRSIIEFLYNASAQENANKICNIYGSRGPEFLRDIYEKYSVSK
jgi:hypothetical protein